MNSQDNQKQPVHNAERLNEDRREMVKKVGKFALYVAPFTIMAATNKASAASAATSYGPGKHR